jgi:hypothetical protein
MGTEPLVASADRYGALVRLLAPHLGETMARASIERHLERLGAKDSQLDRGQLDEMIRRLGQGLNIFLGRARAAEVVEAMRKAMDGVPA